MSINSPLLSDYRADVEKFFDAQSPDIITNKDRHHAAILISTLFKKADREVIVFSRQLDGDFYTQEDVKSQILEAAKRGVDIRILVQESVEAKDLVRDLLKEQWKGKVTVHLCKPGSLGAASSINFTVVDGKAYRLEKNRDNHEAFACANDPKTAQKIIKVFESFDVDYEQVGIERIS